MRPSEVSWIYLSPHFDDAVYSCGGLIWEQSQQGVKPQVWTICAGDPPVAPLSVFAAGLHSRWDIPKNSVSRRIAEDRAACKRVGARPKYFSIPDCIYRLSGGRHLYASEESLFGSPHPQDQPLIKELADQLAKKLPRHSQIVAPLALGNHVDHQIVRLAAERVGRYLWYYPDYPYASQGGFQPPQDKLWSSKTFVISNPGLKAWQDASAAYQSQISTFWDDEDRLRTALGEYAAQQGGVKLWKTRLTS